MRTTHSFFFSACMGVGSTYLQLRRGNTPYRRFKGNHNGYHIQKRKGNRQGYP